jgi:S1-C subfamily serine protease
MRTCIATLWTLLLCTICFADDYASQLLKMAEQGDSEAQYQLGFLYGRGDRIRRDEAEAIRWWQKAAEQGHTRALNNLGWAYSQGRGTVPDAIEACCCFLISAALGEDTAKRNVLNYSGGWEPQYDRWGNFLYNEKIYPEISTEQFAEAQRRAHVRMAAININKDRKRSQARNANTQEDSERKTISGTGFVISQDGYLLTCNHIVQDAKTIEIRLSGKKYPANTVAQDAANDLALLKIDGAALPTLPVKFDMPPKGSKVFTVGFPNPDIQGGEAKFTDGTISSLSGIQGDIRTMQISVPVQPGNSGGALVGDDGNVAGIVVAKLNAVKALGYTGDLPQNVNYAVKISYAMPLIQSVDGLYKRLPPPTIKSASTTVAASAEKATCMVVVGN